MDEILLTTFSQILDPATLLVIALSAAYGIFVGAIPGLTATMAIALMVPLTFYLTDVQAIAAIVTTAACSIFAGDIPATLVRIPGTPASAAYAGDMYRLTQRGLHHRALGISLVFSVLGGLLGTIVLAAAAPQLAKFATRFTSYEYFWLYVLGLTCAVVVSDDSRVKGLFALSIGLLLSTVGLGTDYSKPRLTFGFDELVTGINFIPAMIGLFGMSEVLRNALALPSTEREADVSDLAAVAHEASVSAPPFHPLSFLGSRFVGLLRSSGLGALVGMLPGAGADIAAWISYAVSKRFSKHPEEYGQGSLEGIADATGANNAALGSAWVPALVFGIPGDSVTAIAIGVLLMKNITPGPDIFDFSANAGQAPLVLSVFAAFVVANLLLLPIGYAAIRAGGLLVRVPRRILLPIITMFCIIGSFAMNGSYFDVWVMLTLGLLGFALERINVPLAPIVLGLILGGEVEHRFLQCLTRDPSPTAFLRSSISITLAVSIFLLLFSPVLSRLRTRRGEVQHGGTKARRD